VYQIAFVLLNNVYSQLKRNLFLKCSSANAIEKMSDIAQTTKNA